jgi:hypothetical protein
LPRNKGEANFINNGNNNGFYNNNYNNQGWNSRPNVPFNNQNGRNYSNSFNNQPSIKDLVFVQARIDESLNKKLAANEKVLENLNSTIESFTSAMKNQLSFNKMIETQLAQLAASLPIYKSSGIPGQPEPTREHVSAISTRWGKPSRTTYAPNHVQEEKVASTKPKVDSLITTMRKHWEQDKVFNGRHQPKKSKVTNKAKEEKKTEIKNTPAKASPTSSPPKKTKVWRVKIALSESSTLEPDEPKIN